MQRAHLQSLGNSLGNETPGHQALPQHIEIKWGNVDPDV